MLTDDARTWLRDLVAMPEEDAARELAGRFLGVQESAYRAGAAEMAPGVRNAERDSVLRLIRREMVNTGPVVRGTLLHIASEIEADAHRGELLEAS